MRLLNFQTWVSFSDRFARKQERLVVVLAILNVVHFFEFIRKFIDELEIINCGFSAFCWWKLRLKSTMLGEKFILLENFSMKRAICFLHQHSYLYIFFPWNPLMKIARATFTYHTTFLYYTYVCIFDIRVWKSDSSILLQCIFFAA